MTATITAEVPGGMWRAGVRHRAFRIRPPNGHDEMWVAEHADDPSHQIATGLLERCVDTLTDDRAATPGELAALTVGDREALLWQVRRLGFGDRVDAVVECAECGDTLELELDVRDLLAAPYPDWSETFVDDVAGHRVSYRLPTAEDQQAGAELGPAAVLARCVLTVDDRAHGDRDELDAELEAALDELFAQRDPQAECLVLSRCPGCDGELVAVLDAISFLRDELLRRRAALLREVHTIAWHYHWPEAAILDLPVDRRASYLDLIALAYEDAS